MRTLGQAVQCDEYDFVEKIKSEVARETGCSPERLTIRGAASSDSWARFLAIALVRDNTTLTEEEILELFGGSDGLCHTASEVVKGLIAADEVAKAQVDNIIGRLSCAR